MIDIRPIQQNIDGITYRGTAYVPGDGTAPHPTVILHHGFGSNRIEAFGLFVQISRALAEHGIMAVAFDRAGHGESDGEFFDTTVTGDIAAAITLADMIAHWDEVDPANVHLLGMSIGAVIASAVAVEAHTSIASLTLLSPAAVFADEIRGGTLQGRPIAMLDEVGYFDFNSARLGRPFFDDARTFDAYGRARGFDGPVRVIYGDSDPIVPAAYADRYSDVYGPRVHTTTVPGGDHIWSNAPAREQLLSEVSQFIDQQVADSTHIPYSATISS